MAEQDLGDKVTDIVQQIVAWKVSGPQFHLQTNEISIQVLHISPTAPFTFNVAGFSDTTVTFPTNFLPYDFTLTVAYLRDTLYAGMAP